MILDYYSNSRNEVVDFISFNPQKVLDIGCGKGGFARSLRVKFPLVSITGVDLHHDHDFNYSAVFDKFIQLDILSNLDSIDYTDFDTVSILDVLEHLNFPDQFLNSLTSKLKSGTLVIISLPNFLNYSNIWNILKLKRFKYEDNGILDRTHLRFFTRLDAQEMIHDSGLEIMDCKKHIIFNTFKSKLISFFLGDDYVAFQNIFICKVK
jgi:2-polyprenyl-3-methyl-5-hydroxy-6-metoxy-1,4-benzoquinol methylase